MALFWHMILCAGDNKVDNSRTTALQYDTFRDMGMGNFKDILMWLSTDPCMLYYLDNIESHKVAVNENYGRELLELFSMGVGKDGEFNLHRGRRQSLRPCLYRLEPGSHRPGLPLWPHPL